TLTGHTSSVCALALGPNGRTLVSGGLGGIVKVWDTRARPGPVRAAGFGDVMALTFTDAGRQLVAVDESAAVVRCDAATGRRLPGVRLQQHHTLRGAFAPGGRMVAVGRPDGSVLLCEVPTGKTLHTLRVPGAQVHAPAFSPEGAVLAVSAWLKDRLITITLWDTVTGKQLRSFTAHQSRAPALAFSPDGKTLASGSWDGTVKRWQVATGKELLAF